MELKNSKILSLTTSCIHFSFLLRFILFYLCSKVVSVVIYKVYEIYGQHRNIQWTLSVGITNGGKGKNLITIKEVVIEHYLHFWKKGQRVANKSGNGLNILVISSTGESSRSQIMQKCSFIKISPTVTP